MCKCDDNNTKLRYNHTSLYTNFKKEKSPKCVTTNKGMSKVSHVKCNLRMNDWDMTKWDASESNNILEGKEFTRNVPFTTATFAPWSLRMIAYIWPCVGACWTDWTDAISLVSRLCHNSYSACICPSNRGCSTMHESSAVVAIVAAGAADTVVAIVDVIVGITAPSEAANNLTETVHDLA